MAREGSRENGGWRGRQIDRARTLPPSRTAVRGKYFCNAGESANARLQLALAEICAFSGVGARQSRCRRMEMPCEAPNLQPRRVSEGVSATEKLSPDSRSPRGGRWPSRQRGSDEGGRAVGRRKTPVFPRPVARRFAPELNFRSELRTDMHTDLDQLAFDCGERRFQWRRYRRKRVAPCIRQRGSHEPGCRVIDIVPRSPYAF